MLEKLTGSQRTRGMFYTLSATRLAYLGAGYVNGEKPRDYGQDPKENQVAIVERRAKNKLVFLFPAPAIRIEARHPGAGALSASTEHRPSHRVAATIAQIIAMPPLTCSVWPVT